MAESRGIAGHMRCGGAAHCRGAWPPMAQVCTSLTDAVRPGVLGDARGADSLDPDRTFLTAAYLEQRTFCLP